MMALAARLHAVLELIGPLGSGEAHADIGADHAHLPIRLVQTGRVTRAVVVELNPGPLAHARQNVALAGLQGRIEVRQGDGFGPLAPGEVGSASLCGMGARTMLGVLERAGERLPGTLVMQPNDSPLPLREWALDRGYHLVAERLIAGQGRYAGHWRYPVLRLERRSGTDPAYAGLPEQAARRYGPLLLRSGEPVLRQGLAADVARLTPVAAPGRPAQAELDDARAALAALPLAPA